jgi:hypothetical protein
MGPVAVADAAIAELGDRLAERVRWARLAVHGSLPGPGDFRKPAEWDRFSCRVNVIVRQGLQMGAAWHVPLEGLPKARAFRNAFQGLPVIVRRTSQARTWGRLLAESSRDPIAYVVGDPSPGRVPASVVRGNIVAARMLAGLMRKSGRKPVVCPAIATGRRHCGECTACSDPRVDVVLYPLK